MVRLRLSSLFYTFAQVGSNLSTVWVSLFIENVYKLRYDTW